MHTEYEHTVMKNPAAELPGGVLRLADDLALTRIGYGAMQLAGPKVWGPPRDRDAALAVLRAAVEAGITHIDTSDYYGPHVVNDLVREALHPYPEHLRIATKVGARRTPDRAWPAALSRDELVQAVHDNLKRLDVPVLDLVNLRMTDTLAAADIVEPFTVLAELREQGLIRHLGVSNVSAEQVRAAGEIAPVVTVQNLREKHRVGRRRAARAGAAHARRARHPLTAALPTDHASAVGRA